MVRPLTPRLEAVERTLSTAGLSRDDVAQVLGESYAEATTAAALRRTARATLKLFARHDLFDDPATHDAFHARGLIEA